MKHDAAINFTRSAYLGRYFASCSCGWSYKGTSFKDVKEACAFHDERNDMPKEAPMNDNEVKLSLSHGEVHAIMNALLVVKKADASNPTMTQLERSAYDKVRAAITS